MSFEPEFVSIFAIYYTYVVQTATNFYLNILLGTHNRMTSHSQSIKVNGEIH